MCVYFFFYLPYGKKDIYNIKDFHKKSDGSVIQSKGAKLSVEYFVGCRASFFTEVFNFSGCMVEVVYLFYTLRTNMHFCKHDINMQVFFIT